MQAGSEGAPLDEAPAPLLVALTVMVEVAAALHAQLQAGQALPAGQVGQLQVQVEPLPGAAPPQPVVPPSCAPPQLQLQGGQTSPGRQAGQLQLQVPPPPLPPPSAGGGGTQAHCTGGQLPSAGQASGCKQVHPLPPEARAKQKPAPQSWPTGQSVGVALALDDPATTVTADQAQRLSAVQAVWVASAAQGPAV